MEGNSKNPLYGGSSYNYTYGGGGGPQDPTEMQYFEEQALQGSLQPQQFQYLGQSNYDVEQSYSSSHFQNFGRGSAPWTQGYQVIAEEAEEELTSDVGQQQQQQQQLLLGPPQDPNSAVSQSFQRNTNAAFSSWGIGDSLSSLEAQTKALNISITSTSVDLLLKRGNKNIQGLHKLAAQGDRSGIMQKMKQEGPNAPLNELDSNNCTPLMYASVADSRMAIEMLLNFRARREQTDPEGRTAVHYATFFGKHRALKFLIDTAADWTPSDRYGRTALHWSCAPRGTRCLEFLLTHAQLVMGNLNPLDNEGMTPLHCAALYCRPRHIQLLNEAGCDPSLLDCENKTALHWTAANSDPSCLEMLVDLYPSVLNQQDIYGMTLLHEVSRRGAVQLAPTLLDIQGIDLNVKDNLERTALHWACAEGHSEIVVLLLGHGALDSCIDSYGLTALHYSVHLEGIPSLQAFARRSDMKHLPDNDGMTPLMHAAAKVAPDVVEVLLESEEVVKDVDCVSKDGFSSLHLACVSGANQSVKLLLTKGASVNLPGPAKQTALHLASQNGQGACMQLLVTAGAKMDLVDEDQHTPLHKATLYLQMEAVQVLVMSRADLNIRDGAGNTALHMAVYNGNNVILEVLLEQMANPNLQDNSGMSPLHLAAMEGYVDCVETLLSHKAYVNFIDFSEERYTPLDYARLRNHTECVDLLASAGGVGTEDIEGMAALTIQRTYRGFKARQRFTKLLQRERAATMICKHVRGFLQVRRYSRLRAREAAATKIQALVRAFLQREKFKVVLARSRERKAKWLQLEDFGSVVERGRRDGMLITFVPIYDLSPEQSDFATAAKFRVRERKLRFEASMKMREMDEKRQLQWQAFREAEDQRRKDKADAQELSKLRGIIEDSRAKRDYTSKLQHRMTVRSHFRAAVIIQRAYRRTRKERLEKLDEKLIQARLRWRKETRAARVIQRAWYSYRERKMYKAQHFVSVMSEPVLDIGRRRDLSVGRRLPAYQRGISITGSPKRKLHRTRPSEFKIVRPRTRDLLIGSNRHDQVDGKAAGTRGPSTHLAPGQRTSPRRTPRGITSLFLIKPDRNNGSSVGKGKESVILPKLVTNSVKGNQGHNKTKDVVQLPQIH